MRHKVQKDNAEPNGHRYTMGTTWNQMDIGHIKVELYSKIQTLYSLEIGPLKHATFNVNVASEK